VGSGEGRTATPIVGSTSKTMGARHTRPNGLAAPAGRSSSWAGLRCAAGLGRFPR
jgi:hypothetical protein